MPSPIFINEGGQIDHYGNLIVTHFVDFRHPDDRTSIETLIKGCPEKFAIESRQEIKISAPPVFRQYGENLIRDPAEAFASEKQLISEVVDDPVSLERARKRNSAANRAAKLSGTTHNTRTTSTVERKSIRRTLTAGKNCWIFSTSLEPSSQEEWDLWWNTLESHYDHATYIYSARDFARALAGALVEQMGPQGESEASVTHSFEGEATVKTFHKTQGIFHGPVIYVEDIYRLIVQASSPIQRVLLPLFAKEPRFRDQREYRFVIATAEEPKEQTVILNATAAVLATMDVQAKNRGPMSVPQVKQNDSGDQKLAQQDDSRREDLDDFSLESALIEMSRDPSTRTKPRKISFDNLPDDLEEKTVTYAAVVALNQKVADLLKRGGGDLDQLQTFASAGWFAEKALRQMCQQFTEPVKGISVSPDNFIVIDFALPHWQDIGGKLTIAPTGQCAVTLKKGIQPYSLYYADWEGNPIPDPVIQDLKDFVDPYLRRSLKTRQPHDGTP